MTEQTATFEAWAKSKLGVAIDERGLPVAVARRRGGSANAAYVRAARNLHRVPIGKLMTEAEFTQCIAAVKAIEVPNGSR